MATISTKLAGLRISRDKPASDTATALAGLTFMDFDLAEAVPNIFATDTIITRRTLKRTLQRGGDSTPATITIPYPYDKDNMAHKAMLELGKMRSDVEKEFVVEHDYGTGELYLAKVILITNSLDASGDDFLSGSLQYVVQDNVWEIDSTTRMPPTT